MNSKRKEYATRRSDAAGKLEFPSLWPLFYSVLLSRDETPGEEQLGRFLQICQEFSATNPNDIIGRMLSISPRPSFDTLIQVFIVDVVSIEPDS